MAQQRIMPSSEVVLLGAGHNHIEVIKKYGEMRKKPFRLTLISETCMGSYKGLLGRLLRKELSHRKAFLDLGHFCIQNGVRYLNEKIVSVDVQEKEIHTESSRPTVLFDVASFDLGLEAPVFCKNQEQIEPVLIPRPPGIFYQKLLDVEIQLRSRKPDDYNLVLTGGDLNSVEILFSLWDRYAQDEVLKSVKFTFLNLDPWQREHRHKLWSYFEKRMVSFGIQYIPNAKISFWDDPVRELVLDGGERIKTDLLLHAFGSQGHSVLAKTGLSLDKRGLIRVNPNLESCSHSGIYAVGSSVSWGYPCGVNSRLNYQPKMGTILFTNLFRRFKGLHQISYQSPSWQAQYIYCGKKKAVVCFNQRFFVSNRVAGRKTYKDDLWMKKYKPVAKVFCPPTYLESGNRRIAPCFGTGDEVPKHLFKSFINDEHNNANQDSELHHDRPKFMTNYQRSFSKDHYIFAKVFASHCIGKMIAKGVLPSEAQLIFSVSYGSSNLMKRDLQDMNTGLMEEFKVSGISVTGLHVHASLCSGLGMTLSGPHGRPQHSAWNDDSIHPGSDIVFTKPLGTGMILTGYLNQYVSSEDYHSCLRDMMLSHVNIFNALTEMNPSQVIEVGGSGLLSALTDMLKNSSAIISLDLSRINLYQGVLRAIKLGVRSGLHSQNRIEFTKFIQSLNTVQMEKAEALFDPQTCGGLIVVVKKGDGSKLVNHLKKLGFNSASVIGESLERSSESVVGNIQII